MHLLQLLTLSAGALALPAPTISLPSDTSINRTHPSSPSPLTKRANFGWITTYAPNDVHCMGGYDSRSRPKLKSSGCMSWVPSSEHIGVNFGTYPLSIDSLDLFSDPKCKNKVGSIEPDKGRKLGWTTHANKGVNVCQTFPMGTVLSVRATGIGDEDPLE